MPASEGWRAVWDDFRNWLRLGLQAREREWKSWDWTECRCWERRDRDEPWSNRSRATVWSGACV